jgi:hypothetical protein
MKDTRTCTISIRLTKSEIERIDAEVAAQKRSEPQTSVARADVVRVLLFRELTRRERSKGAA